MKKVAIVAPSKGLGVLFQDLKEIGYRNLRKYCNVDVIEYESACMSIEDVYSNPKKRAEDITNAFLNDDVIGIISLIGGNDSIRILEHLDIESIKKENKWIMGYSDATHYLNYLASNNVKAYYGTSLLAGIVQMHNMGEAFQKHLSDFINGKKIVYNQYEFYANAYIPWETKNYLGELSEKLKPRTIQVLQGTGIVTGELWGGCMESIEQMKSTKYFPSSFSSKIIIFENSEECIGIDQIRRILRNYGYAGMYNQAKAIMFGIPLSFSEKQHKEFKEVIKEIIILEFNSDIPIVINLPIGHTEPVWILPLNKKMKINLSNFQIGDV